MLIYSPSFVAASALFLAIKILYREMGHWTASLQHYTGFTERQIRPCVKDLCTLFTEITSCQL